MEEVVNNSGDRDEHARVSSYISKCSEETEEEEGDASVRKLIGSESLSLHKCLSNDS